MSVQSANGIKPAGEGKTSGKDTETVSRYVHPKPDIAKLTNELASRGRKDVTESAYRNEQIVGQLVFALSACKDATDAEMREWIELARQAMRAVQLNLDSLWHLTVDQSEALPF